MSQIVALGRVLKHKLEELDREIARACTEHEQSYLWRVRGNVRRIWKALIGHEEK